MITRRTAIRLLLGSACIPAAAMADDRQGSVAQATRFIREAGDRLMAILDAPNEASAKREQLMGLIGATMDLNGIARFALGHFWSSANDDQRAEYARLLPAVLVSDLGKAFGNYRGVRFSIDRASLGENTVQVATTLMRPDYSVQIAWMVAPLNGEPKIVDIVAGGFSMRISQRDDCANLLRRCNNSIPALIETLRRQAAMES